MDSRSTTTMAVATSSSPPSRHRKLRRRFSSAYPGSSRWNSFNTSLSPPAISRGRRRQSSASPPSMRSTKRPVDHPALRNVFDTEEDTVHSPDSARTASSHHHIYRREEERRIPLVYSSLPSSPISTSPPPHEASLELPISPTFPPNLQSEDVPTPPFSLWDYLREELLATDFDSHQELKWERVSNFLNIPLAMEKVRPFIRSTPELDSSNLLCQIIGFGFILCLDSFLYTFTILPVRFTLAFLRLIGNVFRSSAPPLPPAQKADILRMLLLVVSVLLLYPLTDASKIYHSIRGQDTIKLYVIFNALEVRPTPLFVARTNCLLGP
jgi:hypothetical protein